jgi:hypothetical protein
LALVSSFNWTPGIGDPTAVGWFTVFLYFCTALSCWAAARHTLPEEGRESQFWRSVAVSFLALGMNKQLDLQTALTEIGRMLAHWQGWYENRQVVQIAFIIFVAVICVTTVMLLLLWVHHAPAPTWLALIGSTMVIGHVLVRAASFHHIDRFIASTIIGLRWNWVLEIGGIAVVLLASRWRAYQHRERTVRPI